MLQEEVSIEAFPHATDYDDPVKVCDHMEQFLQNFDIPFKRLNTKIEFKEGAYSCTYNWF